MFPDSNGAENLISLPEFLLFHFCLVTNFPSLINDSNFPGDFGETGCWGGDPRWRQLRQHLGEERLCQGAILEKRSGCLSCLLGGQLHPREQCRTPSSCWTIGSRVRNNTNNTLRILCNSHLFFQCRCFMIILCEQGHRTFKYTLMIKCDFDLFWARFARAGADITQTFTYYSRDVGVPQGCTLTCQQINQVRFSF